jgi:hypothetical protein
MSEGRRGKESFLTLPGQTRDKIGAYAGVSGRRREGAPAGFLAVAALVEPRIISITASRLRTGRHSAAATCRASPHRKQVSSRGRPSAVAMPT